MHYQIGCDAQGRLTAVKARLIGDSGACASVGCKVLERAAGHACGPYRVPHVDIEAFDGVRRMTLPMKDSPAAKAISVGKLKGDRSLWR